jgi:protein-S-isoprenylcysteine O-methyltransferase Ste14
MKKNIMGRLAWVRGMVAGAAVCAGMAVGSVAQAAPDYSALEAEITSGAAAVITVATAAIVAGFGIFVLIWGARKIKGALSSGG